MSDLNFLTATEMAALLRKRSVSARELMEAHLAQIERVNPQVNAIVTLVADRALAGADAADAALARGDAVGPLHGLPVAHKDLTETKGIRTTFGSPIHANDVPDFNSLIVERLQGAGALTVGKTNTPEFGAGSQTFNQVFGRTLNPYNTAKTCGGSSGGAAVALATGMVPLADGSDMGGSLRNPAAFCNVVGFRPSPGRVPSWPKSMGWSPLAVEGPMARTVEDIALMLTAMAGPTDRSPIALTDSAETFAAPLKKELRGTKIAWSETLGGLPIAQDVTQVLNGQRSVFEQIGCEVISAEPDLTNADHIFKTLRAHAFALGFHELLKTHRGQLKDTVIWNAESGLAHSGLDVALAQEQQSLLYAQMCTFMQSYDYLICPVTQVSPFDVTVEYPTRINDIEMETYIDWMKSCYFITVLGFPTISVPCGFIDDGLPIGMQIVGKHRDDFGVLQVAYAFQQATEFWRQRPALAK